MTNKTPPTGFIRLTKKEIITFAEVLNIVIMKSLLLWSPGVPELILIVVIVLLLFGGKKIPELMRGLGKGIKEFKNASKEDTEENKEDN